MASADEVLACLRRSRAELAALRQQLEQRSRAVAGGQRERLTEQVRELMEEEQELLAAEQRLVLATEERAAEQVLERARRSALEAELQLD